MSQEPQPGRKPLNPPASRDEWYIKTTKGVSGPYRLVQIQGFLKSGKLRDSNFVSTDRKDWRPVSSLKIVSHEHSEVGSSATSDTESDDLQGSEESSLAFVIPIALASWRFLCMIFTDIFNLGVALKFGGFGLGIAFFIGCLISPAFFFFGLASGIDHLWKEGLAGFSSMDTVSQLSYGIVFGVTGLFFVFGGLLGDDDL